MKPLKYYIGATFFAPKKSIKDRTFLYQIVSIKPHFTDTERNIGFRLTSKNVTTGTWSCSETYLYRMIDKGYLVLTQPRSVDLPEELFEL